MEEKDEDLDSKEQQEETDENGEFGEFGPMIDQKIEWDKRVIENSNPLYAEEKQATMEKEAEELRQRAKEIVRHRKELDRELEDLPEDMASTWLKEQRQEDIEHRFRHELALESVGLTNEMISDLADDCMHLVEDSVSDEFRQIRKELRSEMQYLNRYEREKLLKDMLENGRIDEGQYKFLWSEFR